MRHDSGQKRKPGDDCSDSCRCKSGDVVSGFKRGCLKRRPEKRVIRQEGLNKPLRPHAAFSVPIDAVMNNPSLRVENGRDL